MIYTVTFNPSLDYAVALKEFRTGEINRAAKEKILPGGKGINVSVVLKNLGIDSVALGFIAGFTGLQIQSELERMGCRTEFITVKEGLSRINVKIKASEETEINGQGPRIQRTDAERLFAQLERLEDEDILVLAGSVPSTLPEDIYEQIMEFLQSRGRHVRVVVDATKNLLKNVLKYHPFLIKPNHHELGELFGSTLWTKEEIISSAAKLQEMGARNVLVSMAGEGAMLLSENQQVFESPAPEGTVVNSVGAGDSMVAGFLAGYLSSGDYGNAFLTGVSAGSASAFSSELATAQEVEALYHQLSMKQSCEL